MHGLFDCNRDGDHRRMAYSDSLDKLTQTAAGEKDMANNLDEDEHISDQFMRDPYDVMSFYQTNILCEAFTDTQKNQQSEHEKNVAVKIEELYTAISEAIFEK